MILFQKFLIPSFSLDTAKGNLIQVADSFFYNVAPVDPCKDISYALLSAAQRHRNQFTSGSSGCDKASSGNSGEWQGEGWYRFVDGAGNQMADSPVTGT